MLGQRWVYDACGDPVYVAVLSDVLFRGAGQAEEFFEVDSQLQRHESTMTIASSGGGPDAPACGVGPLRRVVEDDPTLIVTDDAELALLRCLDGRTAPAGVTLTCTWSGQPTPVPLAFGSPR